MFRFLHSIFKARKMKGDYPESLVKEAVERAVDGTDPWLHAVSGYKKKLRPAVLLAIDHVNALVDGLPPPKPIGLESRGDDPLVRAFFISTDEMRQVLRNDRNLTDFLRGAEYVPEKVTALLAMEMKETVSFGAEMSGDTVERDMPRKFVTFEAHRLIDPSGDEGENHRLLKRRAYDHLVSLALGRITMLKTEHRDLERRCELLQSKLNIMRRVGWGFEAAGSADSPDISELEEQIGLLESQLLEISGKDHFLEAYLDIVTSVLGRPGEHLWGDRETMILDSMGIRCDEVSSNASEMTFHELFNSEGQRLVVLPVILDGAEIRSIRG
jgi:hypothetical protein